LLKILSSKKAIIILFLSVFVYLFVFTISILVLVDSSLISAFSLSYFFIVSKIFKRNIVKNITLYSIYFLCTFMLTLTIFKQFIEPSFSI